MRFLHEQAAGKVHLYDPAAMGYFKQLFPASPQVIYFNHEFEAMKNADIIIIATDWPQFRGLADVMMTEINPKTLIMDGRRMLQHRYDDLRAAGFSIIAVGSPYIHL